jgi:hypothetical protein
MSFFMSDIISFIASGVLLMRVSICWVCFSVSAVISSSVASRRFGLFFDHVGFEVLCGEFVLLVLFCVLC